MKKVTGVSGWMKLLHRRWLPKGSGSYEPMASFRPFFGGMRLHHSRFMFLPLLVGRGAKYALCNERKIPVVRIGYEVIPYHFHCTASAHFFCL